MIPSAKQDEYLSWIKNGFPQNGKKPKKVVIVGAGMAGLVAGYELLKAGHDPIILEARHRVGGRVYTVREPFADGLHGEAGAMRLPLGHKLTLTYVEKFGLETFPFTMGNPKTYIHLQGKKVRAADFNPGSYDFVVSPQEKGKNRRSWSTKLSCRSSGCLKRKVKPPGMKFFPNTTSSPPGNFWNRLACRKEPSSFSVSSATTKRA